MKKSEIKARFEQIVEFAGVDNYRYSGETLFIRMYAGWALPLPPILTPMFC